MGSALDVEKLEKAFHGRADIIGAIKAATASGPQWVELFNVIDVHICTLIDSLSSSEPASKKRKLEDSSLSHNPAPTATNGTSKTNGDSSATTSSSKVPVDKTSLLQIKEISVVLPQRKKYTIEFTPTHILARNPTTSELVPGISYAYSDITYAFCLPVPEKTAKQYNYVLFVRDSHLPSKNAASPTIDPLILTIPATAPKPGSISGSLASEASSYSDTHKDVFDWLLKKHINVKVEEPNEKNFHSTIKEAHRPNEKALFVKGFRGSKDGYLWFLPSGILWTFRKPVLFIPKSQVVAVSYTSVLQRTFNLNVEVAVAGEGAEGEEEEEIEFAMLDQQDYEGIEQYVKRNGLQDKSMAEQRKAKRLGINDVKKKGGDDGAATAGAGIGADGDEEVGELELAERQLQDEEDEEEEDYDPGSEGDSEGEGDTSDEEESGAEGGGGGDDDDDDDEQEDEEGDEED